MKKSTYLIALIVVAFLTSCASIRPAQVHEQKPLLPAPVAESYSNLSSGQKQWLEMNRVCKQKKKRIEKKKEKEEKKETKAEENQEMKEQKKKPEKQGSRKKTAAPTKKTEYAKHPKHPVISQKALKTDYEGIDEDVEKILNNVNKKLKEE